MATVPEKLEKILSARYGEEVRGAIHDSIAECYSYANGESIEEISYDIVSMAQKHKGAVVFFPNRQKATGNWLLGSGWQYGSYAIIDSGVSSSYGYTDIIPVHEGENIHFTGRIKAVAASSAGYNQIIWLKYNDNSIPLSDNVAVGASDLSSKSGSIDIDIDTVVTVPHGCSGMVVNLFVKNANDDDYFDQSLKITIRQYTLNHMISPHALTTVAEGNKFDNRYEPLIENFESTDFSPIRGDGSVSRQSVSGMYFKYSLPIKIDEGSKTINISGLYATGPSAYYAQLAFYSHPVLCETCHVGNATLVNYSEGHSLNGGVATSSDPFYYGGHINKNIPVPEGAKYFSVTLGGKNNALFYKHSDKYLPGLENMVISLSDRKREPVSKVFADLVQKEKSKKTLKLIGDSITHGMGGTGYAEDGDLIMSDYKDWHVNTKGYCWANLVKRFVQTKFPSIEVINYGCSGINTHDVKNHIKDLVKETDDLVICTIGTNDRDDGSIEKTSNNLGAIVSAVRGMGIPIILGVPSPAAYQDETKRSPLHMEDIVFSVKRVADIFDMDYIDFYDEMIKYCDYKSISVADLLSSSDGLHPNDTGYKVMFNIAMRSLGYPAPIKEQDWIDLDYPLND